MWDTDDNFPALRLLLSTITYSPRSQQLTCLFFFRRLGGGPSIQTSGSGPQVLERLVQVGLLDLMSIGHATSEREQEHFYGENKNKLKDWTFHGVLRLTLQLIIPTLSSAYFLTFYCQHAVLFFIPPIHLPSTTLCSHLVSIVSLSSYRFSSYFSFYWAISMKALENKTLIILRISSYYYIILQTTADVISLWLSGIYFY